MYELTIVLVSPTMIPRKRGVCLYVLQYNVHERFSRAARRMLSGALPAEIIVHTALPSPRAALWPAAARILPRATSWPAAARMCRIGTSTTLLQHNIIMTISN